MKKLVGLLFIGVLFLGGCTSSNKEVTCTLKQDGGKIDYVLDYDSDKYLTELSMIATTDLEEALTQDDLDEIDNAFKVSTDMVEGVDYKLTHDEKTMKSFSIEIIVDMKKYDTEKDVLGFNAAFDDSKKDIKKMKINDIVKSMEADGLKCGNVK